MSGGERARECARKADGGETRASFFPNAPDSRKRDSDEKSPRHLLSSSRITYVGGKAVYVTVSDVSSRIRGTLTNTMRRGFAGAPAIFTW